MARKHIKGRQFNQNPRPPLVSQVITSTDPLTNMPAQIIYIKKGQSKKSYICPYCNGEIAIGSFHIVVVPQRASDLRRHWHIACFKRLT